MRNSRKIRRKGGSRTRSSSAGANFIVRALFKFRLRRDRSGSVPGPGRGRRVGRRLPGRRHKGTDRRTWKAVLKLSSRSGSRNIIFTRISTRSRRLTFTPTTANSLSRKGPRNESPGYNSRRRGIPGVYLHPGRGRRRVKATMKRRTKIGNRKNGS